MLTRTNSPRLEAHNQSISQRNPNSRPRHQISSSYYSSLDFWRKLDHNIVAELESNVSPTFNLKQKQTLPGNSLFGLAITTASYHKRGFQDKYVRYVACAAEAHVPAAQGIAGRLMLAHGFTEYQDDDITASWLRRAVSTGSLTAEEDLRSTHPQECQQIKQEFRAFGGYNSKIVSTNRLFHCICEHPWKVNIHRAEELCDKLGIADTVLDNEGNTLLHYAAIYGLCDVVSLLITKKMASVDITNHGGETPLYKACLSGNTSMVKTLVTLGAVSAPTAQSRGITCLHWLFNFEDDQIHEIAGLLASNTNFNVDARISPLSIANVQRFIAAEHFPFHWPLGTAMHWAVASRSRTAIDALLGLQADIDALDLLEGEDSQTPLALACYRNDADMVEFLLSRGANANWNGWKGRNLIHMMVLDPESSNNFYLQRYVWSWVYHGTYANRLRELKRCLSVLQARGVSQNLRRNRSQTPLIDAVEANDSCAILALVTAGADCNVKSPTGELPVHRWLGLDSRRLDYPMLYQSVLEGLLQGTADIHTGDDSYGESVCHLVVNTQGSNEQLQESLGILLRCNPPANINARDRDGVTPLLSVLSSLDTSNTAARVAILLDHGVNIQERNDNNEDFLHYLCKNMKLPDDETIVIMETIMQRVPQSQERRIAVQSYSQSDGSTSLMHAVWHGKTRMIKHLVSLGVDLNAVNHKNWTALDCALRAANMIRQDFIESVADKIGLADQQIAIDDRTAFETVINWGDLPCRYP